jgi:NAD(P)H-dependent FMN reductase
MNQPRILVFAGSTRSASYNRKLAAVAADELREAGADVTHVDLTDYPMPLYHGDLEAAEGLPESVRELKKWFVAHQGLLLACPEYNSSITPLLKNTIDWVSRKEGDEPSLAAYKGKVVGLTSASTGRLGGLRSLATVRSILSNIGCLVLPTQVAVPHAKEAFDDDGALTDEGRIKALRKLAGELVDATRRMAG